jgi:type IV pilus assembly protein PilW
MWALAYCKKTKGMTIVELMIALVMGLVVLSAVLELFIQHNRTNTAQQEVAYAQQNVRAAMELMARDIRGAGYNPADVAGFNGIVAADQNYIRLQSDTNGDGDTADPETGDPDFGGAPTAPDLTDPQEDITYKLDNLTLLRGQRIANPVTFTEASPGQWTAADVTLIPDVTSFQLGYVLWDGSATTTLDPPGAPLTAAQLEEVRAVILRLSVRTENVDGSTGDYRTRNLVSRVRIRNMGFEDQE